MATDVGRIKSIEVNEAATVVQVATAEGYVRNFDAASFSVENVDNLLRYLDGLQARVAEARAKYITAKVLPFTGAK